MSAPPSHPFSTKLESVGADAVLGAGAVPADAGVASTVPAPTSPEDEEASRHLSQAYDLYSTGKYGDCRVLCERIHHKHPQRLDNLLLLGAAHFQLRNFNDCVYYNRAALSHDPNFAGAAACGCVRLRAARRGGTANAGALCWAEAHGNLGNALKELGDVQGAIRCYLNAIRLKPYFIDPYTNLASAYLATQQVRRLAFPALHSRPCTRRACAVPHSCCARARAPHVRLPPLAAATSRSALPSRRMWQC